MPGKTLYCLGEAWLELNSTAPLASAETFSPRMGGNTGCCQKATTRNLLHDKILLKFSSFRAVRSARVAHRPFIYCTHFSKNF